MALDFHNKANNEYLFGINDTQYMNLEIIFEKLKGSSGIYIDPYGDTELLINNQKLILKIIDSYISNTDLNKNKQKTIDILEFRALINYFSKKGINLKIAGD